jgi:hypothetical protein
METMFFIPITATTPKGKKPTYLRIVTAFSPEKANSIMSVSPSAETGSTMPTMSQQHQDHQSHHCQSILQQRHLNA